MIDSLKIKKQNCNFSYKKMESTLTMPYLTFKLGILSKIKNQIKNYVYNLEIALSRRSNYKFKLNYFPNQTRSMKKTIKS